MSSQAIYLYAYVVFAVVYIMSCAAFVGNALRLARPLVDLRRTVAASPPPAEHSNAARELIDRSQRLVGYTQLATLLPILYIVGGALLGTLITRSGGSGLVSVAWLTFTVVTAAAALLFAVLALRMSSGLAPEELRDPSGVTTEALNRIGIRLGVSAALMLLMAVFTLLNLYTILSNADLFQAAEYVL
ncbi:MAG TPA: hypothetical protein VFE45_09745 [Coriobacteriia bacterium]|nr:hypothetical protein [Coriobacteriia bacterium]